jgi:anthraniloyl-CoA monooxygenase
MSRRVDVIGGGPGGLYVALLLKRWKPSWTVTVYEQRGATGETFGFGVGLTERTMTHLFQADEDSAVAIRIASHGGHGLVVGDHGQEVRLHGPRNLAIGRPTLLEVLAEHAAEAGVDIRDGEQVHAQDLDADVIIAADGVRSGTREWLSQALGEQLSIGRGKFIWCGADFALENAIFVPARTADGIFVAHAYPYAGDRSTFLIEADDVSLAKAGLGELGADAPDNASDEASIRYLSEAFSEELGGRELLGNRSRWSQFYTVRLLRWYVDNVVLIGDAAHTAHYSLGSGTKLALEDAIALARNLVKHVDIQAAFGEYEKQRRGNVEYFQQLACRSQRWWESYPLRSEQPLSLQAVGFMTRSGKVDLAGFAEDNPDAVLDVLDAYSEKGLERLPSDVDTWVLGQPTAGRSYGLIDESQARGLGARRIVWNAPDPWGSDGDEVLSRVDADQLLYLTGNMDHLSAQGRIDFSERLKFERPGVTTIVAMPAELRAEAAAALACVRCDLVHLTDL